MINERSVDVIKRAHTQFPMEHASMCLTITQDQIMSYIIVDYYYYYYDRDRAEQIAQGISTATYCCCQRSKPKQGRATTTENSKFQTQIITYVCPMCAACINSLDGNNVHGERLRARKRDNHDDRRAQTCNDREEERTTQCSQHAHTNNASQFTSLRDTLCMYVYRR